LDADEELTRFRFPDGPIRLDQRPLGTVKAHLKHDIWFRFRAARVCHLRQGCHALAALRTSRK